MTISKIKAVFKIAVAAAVSFLIVQQLHWNYPMYSVVAAIIVMSTTYNSTYTLAIQRVIGTIIGALGGAIFAVIFGSNVFSLGIAVFLTTLLASWKFQETSKLAGPVSAIVILNYAGSAWFYAWMRFLETLVGVVVALLVNYFLFPTHAGDELRKSLAQTLIKLEEFYSLVTKAALKDKYNRSTAEVLKGQIINSLQKERALWKEIQEGYSGEPVKEQIDEVWEFLVNRVWEHILTMEHTILVRENDRLWQNLSPHLTYLAQETSTAFLELSTAIKIRAHHFPLPLLEDTLLRADKEILLQENFRQGDEQSLNDLLRFFTFFYTMQEVGRKLQKMSNQLLP